MENPEDSPEAATLATVAAPCIPDLGLPLRPASGNRAGCAWSHVLDTPPPDAELTAADMTLDARGHHCPVPTLRLRRALEGLTTGQTICLLADDPMARIDVPHFVSQTGHELLISRDLGGWQAFVVRKQG
jgi:tRNA 2-thiouridine synthesizing protein A